MKTGLKIALCIAELVIFFYAPVQAQSPVVALTTTYNSTTSSITAYSNTPADNSGSFTTCVTTPYNYSFNNGSDNALKLLNITANGQNYFIVESAPAIIKLRRVNNANITGNRSIIFMESSTSPSTNCPGSLSFGLKSPYQDDMEDFLNNNYINQGTDNIFTNKDNDDGNNNNIERVDVIFPAGISILTSTGGGFALFDRGVNNAHDGFRIAAITSLDVNGDPASFGAVKTCVRGNEVDNNGSWGHPAVTNGNQDLSVYVLRHEENETQLKTSAAVNQQIGGVFFTFADLGIGVSQTIYGYALLPPDGLANPTSAQLLNLNDPVVYPLNTTELDGAGLDLIALNALFSNGTPTLPKIVKDFSGKIENSEVEIKWMLENPAPFTTVSLEKSPNNRDFISLYSKTTNSNENVNVFKYKETETFAYYRLKIETPVGKTYYSDVIRLSTPGHAQYKIYPTISSSNKPFYIEGLENDLYKIELISLEGKQSIHSNVLAQNRRVELVPPFAGFQKGVHILSVKSKYGKVLKTSKVVVH